MRTPTSTTACNAAADASEAIRTLNHATSYLGQAADDYWPSDLYTIVGELAFLAHRLPQALNQLTEALLVLRSEGRIGHDDGIDVDDELIATIAAPLAEAGERAAALGRNLDRAHSGLAHLQYRESDLVPPEGTPA